MQDRHWSKHVRIFGVMGVALASAQIGCSSPSAEDDIGVVQVALAAVPADVRCVRITAQGSRAVSRSFDVTPSMSATLLMNGVPLGSVQFRGEAFAGACATVTDASIASWSSEAVTANVVANAVTDVALVMRRNGSARVSVDFQDETPACLPRGVMCLFPGAVCCPGTVCDPAAAVCVAPQPSCTDGVRNGAETDVDCGGPTCPRCDVGDRCLVASDCLTPICVAGVCQCAPPGSPCP